MSEPAGDPEAPRKPEAAGTARLRTQYEGLPPAAVKAIAALFCVGVEQESFAEPPDAPAYSVLVRGPIGNVRLLCWPGLNRVDVTCGAHAWIAKQVSETEIIDGLEVIFSTRDGATLLVACTGDVLLVTAGSHEAAPDR